MSLRPGSHVGQYEVLAPIGEGGMGAVFRARDTKLDRDVAIKTLPEAFARDADRLARFTREAKTLASLNHPNIAAIYGLEEREGMTALVMELVEGEDLSVLIARGAPPGLSIEAALPIARQIAEALEAAHEQGIIHRDLKPANIKVRTDGTVKVLDFGLAKATDPAGASTASASALANSPTITSPAMTEMGMILGTAAYMSPEQAKGRSVDKRADIWAFGAVLYEMLTGRRLFEAEGTSETLAAVLTRDVNLTSLPSDVPLRLRALLRDCLVRDPKQRLRDIGDARLALEKIIAGAPDEVVAPGTPVARRRSPDWFGWTAAAVLGAIAVGTGALAVVHLREIPAPVDPVQFTIAAEEGSALGTPQFAVSSDGRQLVFVASTQSVPMLWVRPLAGLAARALPGTEGASVPFWSPDGQDIGFFAAGKLKKIRATGGPATVLCDAQAGAGGTWNRDNVIVFAAAGSPLRRVDAAGGIPTPVTTFDTGETAHRWPSFLPDGQHMLYLAVRRGVRELRVASLGSADTAPVDATGAASLGVGDSHALYASGRLLFSRDGNLMAQAFDPETRQRSGNPFLVAERVWTAGNGRALFSVSSTGVLVCYRGAVLPMSRLTWMDRAGKALGTVGDVGTYYNLSLSPDERRLAVATSTGTPTNRDIWLIDLARADTASRLTFDPAGEGDPIWSPDGLQVLFSSSRNGGTYSNAFRHQADGGGEDAPVVTMDLFEAPDWSHDGRSVVFTAGAANRDLWILPLSGDRKPAVFLQTPFQEGSPAFSPDDRWLAYESDASGRWEIYVRRAAPGGGQLRISRNGGWAPKWRGDGKEIFFLAPDGTMMAASVTLDRDIQTEVPRALFPTALLRGTDRHTYVVTSDGRRFLFPVPDPKQALVPLTVVLNWPEIVKE